MLRWGVLAVLVLSLALAGRAMPPPQQQIAGPDGLPQQMMIPSDEPRLALIISQSAYEGDLSVIAQAADEADMIAMSLDTLGFSIDRRFDLSRAELAEALDDFRVELDMAGPEAVGFVYYTGHGAQHPETEESYLLGVDAKLRVASDLAIYGLDMATQRDGLSATGAKAVFMVFDACRNTGGLGGYKTTTKGLSRVEAKADMLIAYATGLGDVAREGVYAPILAEELLRPGQPAEAAFANAQRRVADATSREQLPWTNNLLYNTVCFAGCSAIAPIPVIDTTERGNPITPLEGTGSSTSFRDCANCPDMVNIPAGSFLMGSPSTEEGRYTTEGPQFTVTIGQPFAIMTTEATWELWDACVADGGCVWQDVERSGGDEGWGRGTRPVVNVTREDADDLAAWLTAQTGYVYRLPSEAEWEYVARAGNGSTYPFDGQPGGACAFANILDQDWVAERGIAPRDGVVGCSDGVGIKTAPVASFEANAFGVYDMIGNASEWVADDFERFSTQQPVDGRAYRTTRASATAVYRGGSFEAVAKDYRSAARRGVGEKTRSKEIGFRLVSDRGIRLVP